MKGHTVSESTFASGSRAHRSLRSAEESDYAFDGIPHPDRMTGLTAGSKRSINRRERRESRNEIARGLDEYHHHANDPELP